MSMPMHISRKTEDTKPSATIQIIAMPHNAYLAHFIRKYGANLITHQYADKPEKITKMEYSLATYLAYKLGWPMTMQLDEAKRQLEIAVHDMPFEWREIITVTDEIAPEQS